MQRLLVVLSFVLVVLIGCGGEVASGNISKEVSDLRVIQNPTAAPKITARDEPVQWGLTDLTSNVKFQVRFTEIGEVDGLMLWPGQEITATYELINTAPLDYDLRGSLPELYNSGTFSNNQTSSSNITIHWMRSDKPEQPIDQGYFTQFRLHVGPTETVTIVAHIRLNADAPAKASIGSLKLKTERLELSK